MKPDVKKNITPEKSRKKKMTNEPTTPTANRLSAAKDAKLRPAATPKAGLRERMLKFSNIYNAAWMVRHYQRGAPQSLAGAINRFCSVLEQELEKATDNEALIYAVAESLTLSPHGMPWEGRQ